MNKKVWLSLLLVFALAACGGGSGTTNDATAPETAKSGEMVRDVISSKTTIGFLPRTRSTTRAEAKMSADAALLHCPLERTIDAALFPHRSFISSL